MRCFDTIVEIACFRLCTWFDRTVSVPFGNLLSTSGKLWFRKHHGQISLQTDILLISDIFALTKFARSYPRPRRRLLRSWRTLDLNNKRSVCFPPSVVFCSDKYWPSDGCPTMGELCRKVWEKILADIITILHGSSLSNDDRKREGVCMALSEILSVTSRYCFIHSNHELSGRVLPRSSERDMKRN